MGDGSKRKQGPGGGGPAHKKSKGGSGNKWLTSHQKAKQAERTEMGKSLEIGDQGLWVTHARGMRGKALREFKELCDAYGQSMYGLKASGSDEPAEGSGEEEQDIEASIKAELEEMKASRNPKTRQVFTPISTGLECIFFVKTMDPVKPGEFVRKICQDAKACADPMARKVKYINRLTPIFDTEKATENGIERVARAVMAPFFELVEPKEDGDESATAGKMNSASDEETAPFTYAIRQNIRNHTTFKSDVLIKKIAGLVSPKHKVNLTKPDKVILVEIFQLFCGVSVVDGKEWDELKRYNMNELYKVGPEKDAAEKADSATEPAPAEASE